MKIKKKLIAIVLILTTSIIVINHYRARHLSELSCRANVNLFYHNKFSNAPIINAILYLKLNNDGYGIEELDGTIEWKGEVYPLSKLIKVKHDFKGGREGLLTLHVTSIASRAYDKSPQGVEEYLIGAPHLPDLVLRYKRAFDNGYIIGNLSSPVLICIEM